MKKINENPDTVYFRNQKILYDDGKPVAFGYFIPYEEQFKKNSQLFFGKNLKHYELKDYVLKYFDEEIIDITMDKLKTWSFRNVLTYPGRIWTDKKIISFWKFPKSQSEKMKVIKDLEKATKQKIINNPEWLIELDEGSFETAIHFITGKDITYAEWKSTQHVKAGRFDREIPIGVGSKKKKGNLTQTQYHQKRFTSEEVKFKKLLESPDYLRTLDGNSLEYNDKEAHAFTYVKKDNKLLVSKRGEMHLNIFLKNPYLDDINLKTYNGRIWIKHKYISFWDYPNNISIHKKIIKELEKQLKIKIDNNDYKVEIKLGNFISIDEFLGNKQKTKLESIKFKNIINQLIKEENK